MFVGLLKCQRIHEIYSRRIRSQLRGKYETSAVYRLMGSFL